MKARHTGIRVHVYLNIGLGRQFARHGFRSCANVNAVRLCIFGDQRAGTDHAMIGHFDVVIERAVYTQKAGLADFAVA